MIGGFAENLGKIIGADQNWGYKFTTIAVLFFAHIISWFFYFIFISVFGHLCHLSGLCCYFRVKVFFSILSAIFIQVLVFLHIQFEWCCTKPVFSCSCNTVLAKSRFPPVGKPQAIRKGKSSLTSGSYVSQLCDYFIFEVES